MQSKFVENPDLCCRNSYVLTNMMQAKYVLRFASFNKNTNLSAMQCYKKQQGMLLLTVNTPIDLHRRFLQGKGCTLPFSYHGPVSLAVPSLIYYIFIYFPNFNPKFI